MVVVVRRGFSAANCQRAAQEDENQQTVRACGWRPTFLLAALRLEGLGDLKLGQVAARGHRSRAMNNEMSIVQSVAVTSRWNQENRWSKQPPDAVPVRRWQSTVVVTNDDPIS